MRDKLTFIAVGVSATALYSLGTSALVRATAWPPYAAGFVVYCLVIPLAYLAQKGLTFRAATRHRESFPRYVGLQVSGLTLTTLANALVVDRGNATPVLLFAIAAVAAALNYLVMRSWVFRERGAPGGEDGLPEKAPHA